MVVNDAGNFIEVNSLHSEKAYQGTALSSFPPRPPGVPYPLTVTPLKSIVCKLLIVCIVPKSWPSMNPATTRVSSVCISVTDKSEDKVPAVFTCTDLEMLSTDRGVEIKKTKKQNVYFFMMLILNIYLLLSFSVSAHYSPADFRDYSFSCCYRFL